MKKFSCIREDLKMTRSIDDPFVILAEKEAP